jgi:hydrogenase expression/formation protein HypE
MEGNYMDKIMLSHGSGRGLQNLLQTVILPSLIGDHDGVLEDAAVLGWDQHSPVVFTTDSFVVKPLTFPGGDIGKLAACGTINDLAMMGATPRFISVALIIEEGLPIEELKKYLNSLRTVCQNENVSIACGDTKVIEQRNGDGLFISTSGIGYLPKECQRLSAGKVVEGDAVIVSGPIGLHGIAILAQRENLSFASNAVSDCGPLLRLSKAVLSASSSVRVMRDATRGGCAAVLNEIAMSSRVSIVLEQSHIPVPEVVRCACEILGMDPLCVANEGTFVAIVPECDCRNVLESLHKLPEGRNACRIGHVIKRQRFPVQLITEIGGIRAVEIPPGQLLPRIC